MTFECSLVEVFARDSRAIGMLARASGVAGRCVRVRARGLSVVLLARLLLLVFWLGCSLVLVYIL